MLYSKEINVLYLSSFEYPSKHGHPLQALSMARAFSKLLKRKFLFVVGKADKNILKDIPHIAPLGFSFFLFKALGLRAFALKIWLFQFLYFHSKRKHKYIIYTNDLKIASMANKMKIFFPIVVITEVHGSTKENIEKQAMRSDKIIFVTEGLKRRFIAKYPNIGNSIILKNAIDIEPFITADTTGIREELGIPSKATVIGYVGRFRPMNTDKGVDFMIDTLKVLPNNFYILLVGGIGSEINEAKKRAGINANRLFCIPFTPFDERVRYMKSVDILVYVPPTVDFFLAEETSPMKFYEYMASKKPIIASDIPAFREALEENAWFISPGSVSEFVSAVSSATPDDIRVQRAYESVLKNTWDSRAKKILDL